MGYGFSYFVREITCTTVNNGPDDFTDGFLCNHYTDSFGNRIALHTHLNMNKQQGILPFANK